MFLKKKISFVQWISLFVLIAGVALVQLAGSDKAKTSAEKNNAILGFLAVSAACCTSGFAGVYLEKLVKKQGSNVWIRSMQLSLIGIISGWLYLIANSRNSSDVYSHFFDGYDWCVWVVISFQSLGGIMVALVVKYADNILKGFSTSIAIIVASVFSYFFFDFVITYYFGLGTTLVLISTFMYGINPTLFGSCIDEKQEEINDSNNFQNQGNNIEDSSWSIVNGTTQDIKNNTPLEKELCKSLDQLTRLYKDKDNDPTVSSPKGNIYEAIEDSNIVSGLKNNEEKK